MVSSATPALRSTAVRCGPSDRVFIWGAKTLRFYPCVVREDESRGRACGLPTQTNTGLEMGPPGPIPELKRKFTNNEARSTNANGTIDGTRFTTRRNWRATVEAVPFDSRDPVDHDRMDAYRVRGS